MVSSSHQDTGETTTTNIAGGRLDNSTGSAAQTTATTAGSTVAASTPAVDPLRNITTTFVISNLHCSSCTTTVRLLLTPLSPPPITISTNILTHEVTVVHLAELNPNEILRVLLEAEFEVDSVCVNGPGIVPSPVNLRGSRAPGRGTAINHFHMGEGFLLEDWGELVKAAFESGKKRRRHVAVCEACRTKEEKRVSAAPPASSSPGRGNSECNNADGKGAILQLRRRSGERPESNEPCIGTEDQKTITQSAASYSTPVIPSNKSSSNKGHCGSQPTSDNTSDISVIITPGVGVQPAMATSKRLTALQKEIGSPSEEIDRQRAVVVNVAPLTAMYEATFSIEGMTCSACTGKVNDTIQHLPGVKSVHVALMTNSATVEFEGSKEDASKIVDEIEDIGYGCELQSIKELNVDGDQMKSVERVVQIRVDGMFCETCPTRVIEALNTFGDTIKIEKPLTSSDPVLEISYHPAPPNLTIRRIISTLDAINPAFKSSIYHPPTIEERSRHIQRTELRRLIIRAILCIIIAIPTFMIGIVWMSLVPKDNSIRQYLEEPMWAGRATRLEWALFFLSTPVQFFIADVFHVRAIKEIKALWRPGSQVPILRRFYRFGSMNLLISLGVSIAYFASVGLLAVAATRDGETTGHHTTYFDSTVFLTMFLLIGRCLESYSKIKTSDAVSMLGKLRPTEALLLITDESPISSSTSSSSTGDLNQKTTLHSSSSTVKKVPVDMLEVGDIIVVQHGGSPPADGRISLGQTKFDESSLTGEARPVQKKEGDVVYAGTINQGKAVRVVVDAISGDSMLDQIVKVVREGQTRRAPIERVADIITGYFVPCVTLIAISTWVIWLALGQSGVLEDYWLDVDEGSWPVWSLGFAIAVFVVACPCGIGLAAPTALFVGSGLAAKHGILAKGGGEAFQEASWLDVIVFDKTGTLTEGGEPKVTDEQVFVTSNTSDEEKSGDMLETAKLVYAVSRGLEEMSSHPLAKAVVSHCETKQRADVVGSEIEEVPGRGLRGVFTISNSTDSYEAIIGNEAFLKDNGIAELGETTGSLLHSWKSKGKSVVLLAIKSRSSTSLQPFSMERYILAAAFAASDPLRPEAIDVVKNLRASGISVWMISGDNPVTATAVAGMVGIPRENVIAGVLPTQKAEKVQWLQANAPMRERRNWFGKRRSNKRAVVAMVGDGINDAPALSVSDVGIAIGSGSDIAIGSAKFILVSSNLYSLLTLTELSRKVFRRVKFNFFWACIYNLIALPVAAGVLYPVGMRNYSPPKMDMNMGDMAHSGDMMHGSSGGPQRIRLEPVWASLAMALSSVSVVGSSLLLRTRWWGVGFRATYKANNITTIKQVVAERKQDEDAAEAV